MVGVPHAGILVVRGAYEVSVFRKPKRRYLYALGPGEKYEIARLGYLRMWDLKRKVKKLKNILSETKIKT